METSVLREGGEEKWYGRGAERPRPPSTTTYGRACRFHPSLSSSPSSTLHLHRRSHNYAILLPSGNCFLSTPQREMMARESMHTFPPWVITRRIRREGGSKTVYRPSRSLESRPLGSAGWSYISVSLPRLSSLASSQIDDIACVYLYGKEVAFERGGERGRRGRRVKGGGLWVWMRVHVRAAWRQ